MGISSPEIQQKGAAETRNVSVDFSGRLDAGELLTGTPTITENTTSDLTITNKVVSTDTLTIRGNKIGPGQAVQCRVAGGTAGRLYSLTISVGTTGSQTLVDDDIKIEVV